MKFSIQRELLLKPLQTVVGVVEKRQTMPVLSNLLLQLDNDRLTMTGTDLEVELVACIHVNNAIPGSTTVPGKKLLDICKALPNDAEINISYEGSKVMVQSGRSRFTLACLPVEEFPSLDDIQTQHSITLPQENFKRIVDKTGFCMAQQDVRYYLNGLLIEVTPDNIRAVATDGHRLALADSDASGLTVDALQVIVPRKGISELQKLVGNTEDEMKLQIGTNHVRVELGDIRFTSKLVDGRFPEYSRVLPQRSDTPVVGERIGFKAALHRASILSNEKYRGVRFSFQPDTLNVQAHNPEQEEAEEEFAVQYAGIPIEIGFNASYFQDALGALDGEQFMLSVVDSNSSCLIKEVDSDDCLFVVMPMRL